MSAGLSGFGFLKLCCTRPFFNHEILFSPDLLEGLVILQKMVILSPCCSMLTLVTDTKGISLPKMKHK